MINWKVRFKNKTFWITLIPAVIILLQTVLALFGVVWDGASLSTSLVTITNMIFVILAILGVVVDPTTEGIDDSAQAMTYTEPKETR